MLSFSFAKSTFQFQLISPCKIGKKTNVKIAQEGIDLPYRK